MNPEIKSSEIDKMLGGNRSVFDGMAGALLDAHKKSKHLAEVASVENVYEGLSILRKLGITDQEMSEYLKTRQEQMDGEFNKKFGKE